MENNFKNIQNNFRPIPFWSWNDKLNPDFLKWQIGEMKKVGLGGYFMHARGGLETDYLSNNWMKCIKTGIEEGKKEGLSSWIYDENGWPSGFAGGIITAMGDRFYARGLIFEEVSFRESIENIENILCMYLYDTMSNKTTSLGLDAPLINNNENTKLLIVRQVSDQYYIDVLNKDVVKAFIESTHEKYYEHFGDEFGKGLLGFFTDEPRLSAGTMPWSYIYQESFIKRYGYNIIDFLPALFIDCQGFEKIRYDFWKLINELFVTSFIKQIGQWCEVRNCKLTGHIMMEESVYSQMTSTGGVMPFYQYMGIPGMDWLRRTISNPIVPKQVSSVANQLGKKAVLTETFALCGWNVSFEELKWIAEWQYVNGVNLICQHLEAYTLRGLRKRDYPPSLFYQQPWWEEYKLLNDYFGRLGTILSAGKNVANVLLIHPIRSGWISYDGTNNKKIKKIDEDFIKISEKLSAMHIDYHFGDETIIANFGSVHEKDFHIGKCCYKVIILPSMITIDRITLTLLEKFIKNGGKVISVGDMPTTINGVPDITLGHFLNNISHTNENSKEFYNLINKSTASQISISEDGKGIEVESIHYQQRRLEDSDLFFMVNHNTEKTFMTTISFNGNGRIRKINMENGDIEDVIYTNDNGCTRTQLQFLPMQSYLLLFYSQISTIKEIEQINTNLIRPKANFQVEKMDLNSLTLDCCSYSIDNGQWRNPLPVIKLMDLLLQLKRSCEVSLKFNFNMEIDPKKCTELYVVIEKEEEFLIYVNGELVPNNQVGWWRDSEFKKIYIKDCVKQGENEIILKRKFYQSQKVYDVIFGENVYETEKNKLTYDVELESIYIIGDFGVVSESKYINSERNALITKGPFKIVDKPLYVTSGDLTSQGLCFFSGSIKLTQNIIIIKDDTSRILLVLNKPNAPVTKLYINDKLAKTMAWAPYNVDITDFIIDGENKLTIELFSSNRNLLGPHHHINGEVYNVGPLSFTGKWSWCERASEANVVTEEERVKDYWSEDYCLVKFGL